MFQSLFTSNRLCLPIIELPVRVNMEPAPSLIVLVSLDIARLALPIVGAGFIGKCSLDRCIMPEVYLGLGLSLFVCGILSFVLELVIVCSLGWGCWICASLLGLETSIAEALLMSVLRRSARVETSLV
jgi:hypothetical protein